MLKVILLFAVLTLVAGGFGFGWFGGGGHGVSRVLFWIFAVLLVALVVRALTRDGEETR